METPKPEVAQSKKVSTVLNYIDFVKPIEYDENYDLVFQDDKIWLNPKGTETLYECDMGINSFIKFCDKFGFDEIFLMNSEIALNRMGRERLNKRLREE